MALGAQHRSLVRMVLGEVCLLAGLGLGLSIPIALVTSKFVESFLYGMKHNDPLALIVAVTILLSAALLAGYLPVRLASRIDPMSARRNE